MSKSVFYSVATFLLVSLLLACGDAKDSQNDQPESLSALPKTAGICQDPRPEVCTLQYDPVCGYGEAEQKAYSSGCAACADPAVQGWVLGAC